MSDKVVSLNCVAPATVPADPHIVAVLEDMLERAKSGDIIGIGFAALHSDGTASNSICGAVESHGLIGALAVAQFRASEAIMDSF